jgi:hypothetical protein
VKTSENLKRGTHAFDKKGTRKTGPPDQAQPVATKTTREEKERKQNALRQKTYKGSIDRRKKN